MYTLVRSMNLYISSPLPPTAGVGILDPEDGVPAVSVPHGGAGVGRAARGARRLRARRRGPGAVAAGLQRGHTGHRRAAA